ncbi:serine/threonine-protein kinase [Actinoplanes sp. TFC3]|uniref:serine/threonine-protein kinase n=1 Tax=Actinoplanes sp. TFC3 TaxID=1710355 RepID=UPI00082E8C17|nr:serine/threonine-protein kinase [Actinoplanes sp. TFC3]
MARRSGPGPAPLGPADPRRLGDYRLTGRLGAGGMGVVYAAVDRAGRPVAVKLVHAALAADDEFRRRFRREVTRARQVPPFCTAAVLDADTDHEPPYLVFEYIDGPSLHEDVEQRGPLAPADLHSVAIGMATALTAIHGAGVVHRDLKPSNVLLAPGSPKVIDFGIAQDGQPASAVTHPHQLAGTIAYMAPERFDAAPVTTAADIFSWGLVVAYAGTGRNPFDADSPSSIAGRILTQHPDLSGLPDPLRQVVAAALAKDPAARPDARELLDRLLLTEPRPASYRPVVSDRAALKSRSRRRRFGAILACLVLAAAAVAVMSGPHLNNRQSPAQPSVPVEPTGGTPLFSDPLSRSGQWMYTDRGGDAICTITDALHATRLDRGVTLCIGPHMRLTGSHSIAVDAVLDNAGSCAAIWLFWTGEHGGYVVRICQNDISLAIDRGSDRRVLAGLRMTRPLQLNHPLNLKILASTTQVVVFLEHRYLGSFALPAGDRKDGADVLGLSVDALTAKPPFGVTYANVDIRTYGS